MADKVISGMKSLNSTAGVVPLSRLLDRRLFRWVLRWALPLLAMLQLLAASFVWTWHVNISQLAMNGETMSTIVSLSGGALVANLISVVLLIGETLRQTR